MALYLFCLLLLLTKVEYINTVAATRMEIEQLRQQQTKVNDLRNEVKNFADQSVQLTELWVYCTIPRLDLMKEVFAHLQGASSEDLVPLLRSANPRLAQLEMWCGGLLAPQSEAKRRCLSSSIDDMLRSPSRELIVEGNDICHRARLDSLLGRLDNLFAVEDGEPPSSESSFQIAGMRRTPMMESFCSRERGPISDISSSVDSEPALMESALQQAQREAQRARELMRPAVAQLQTDFLRPAAAQLQGMYNFVFAAPQSSTSLSTLSEPLAIEEQSHPTGPG